MIGKVAVKYLDSLQYRNVIASLGFLFDRSYKYPIVLYDTSNGEFTHVIQWLPIGQYLYEYY